MQLTISDSADLARARGLAAWLARPHVRAVVVTLPWLTDDERRRAALMLRASFNECGCTHGAIAFVAALGWTVRARPWGEGSLASGIAYVVSLSIAAAVAGKLAGLSWSWWRLRVLLSEMARRPTRHEGRVTAWH